MKFHRPRGEEWTVMLIIASWSEENHEKPVVNTNGCLLLGCAVKAWGLSGLTKYV